MSAQARLSRRRLLRGTFAGATIGVGLPLLDCFLNENGNAFASGAPLPTRFVSWFWGLGFTPGRWAPKDTGSLSGQALGPEMIALEPVKAKINIYSQFRVQLDGKPNQPHVSGWVGQLSGTAPAHREPTVPTVDMIVADAIGTSTRFRSLVATCTGNARDTVSYRAGSVQQPGETSPAQLYGRIFGADFRDPNGATFAPSPSVMMRRSVLSFIADDRRNLVRNLGSADRARLDEYFTSLRELEHQFDLQLEKPAPLDSCVVPEKFAEVEVGTELETSLRTNRLMSQLLAHALACNQTRVVSILFSTPASTLRIAGTSETHHVHSHQEPVDPQLGYQKQRAHITTRAMEGLATLIQILDGIKEGEGTLLDRSLVMATTDCGDANTHKTENVPIITAGRAGGTIKTGFHVENAAESTTRVGLTAMQAMKLPISRFGTESNEASRSVSEVLA